MSAKLNTRPLPQNPEYQLAECGRLFGPCGQVRPNVQRNCRPRSARYCFMAGGKACYAQIRDLMVKVWDLDFVPSQAWVEAARSEVEVSKQDRNTNANRRKKARARAAAQRAVIAVIPAPPAVEEWLCVPEEPRYELSNMGRMRGPLGLLSPYIKPNNRAKSALYMIKGREGKTKGVMICATMMRLWDIEFVPDQTWVDTIRAEALTLRRKRQPEFKLVSIERRKVAPPEQRRCKDCGGVLSAGYWLRCPDCWCKVRRGLDMPLEEYGTCASGGRRS
jgi:hypothetical protein